MVGDSGAELSAIESMVIDWEQRGQDRLARVQELTERVSAISATERVGAVEVTVDSRGLPTEIKVDDNTELSAEIVAALHKAQSRLPELMERVAAEEGMAGDGVVSHLLDTARSSFSDPEPAEPTRGGVRQEDESFEDRSVFNDD